MLDPGCRISRETIMRCRPFRIQNSKFTDHRRSCRSYRSIHPSIPQAVAWKRSWRPLPQPLPLFPADNWWNLDISNWPVDQNSSNYINFINNGGTRSPSRLRR
jgi:hypothetical protein